jgi:hypothetical protein
MTCLKPPALTRRLVNTLVSRLRTGGVATLTVPGRSTGRPRAVPVIPVEVDGASYLVSPFGESDWVRNLRKAPGSYAARPRRRWSGRPSCQLPRGRPSSPPTARAPAATWTGTSFGCPIPATIPSSGSRRRAASHRHARTADAVSPNRSLVLDLDGQPTQH